MTKQFFTIRTHSHTDKQQLWKVMSRPMVDLHDARNWLAFCKLEEKNANHEFFVVERVSDEVESTRPIKIGKEFYQVHSDVQDHVYDLKERVKILENSIKAMNVFGKIDKEKVRECYELVTLASEEK